MFWICIQTSIIYARLNLIYSLYCLGVAEKKIPNDPKIVFQVNAKHTSMYLWMHSFFRIHSHVHTQTNIWTQFNGFCFGDIWKKLIFSAFNFSTSFSVCKGQIVFKQQRPGFQSSEIWHGQGLYKCICCDLPFKQESVVLKTLKTIRHLQGFKNLYSSFSAVALIAKHYGWCYPVWRQKIPGL